MQFDNAIKYVDKYGSYIYCSERTTRRHKKLSKRDFNART